MSPPDPDALWDRRRFLAASGMAAGALALGASACANGSGAPDAAPTSSLGGSSGGGAVADGLVPDEATIHGWIDQIVQQGIRRPGYPADDWATAWATGQFKEIGLTKVRIEPVSVTRWEPTAWSLVARPSSGPARTLTCYPVPFARPVDGLELELAALDETAPESLAGRAALVDTKLISIPADLLVTAGSAPKDTTGRVIDPDGTLAGHQHLVPFCAAFQDVTASAEQAGAAAFIGSLVDYPGDSCRYFVPYDAVPRKVPGVWVSGSTGAWLHARLAEGPVHVRLEVTSTEQKVRSHNVVGELPGVDDQTVMIGSHHDGPWASAVEDGSGISLVLAQATYWARRAQQDRPHRLVFVLHAGHMSGGAGLKAYVDAHRGELDDVVLEVHLEHAALEFDAVDGTVAATGRPVPRWWFTSRIPPLEQAVGDALRAEGVNRSMVLAPDAFGEHPPTDGATYDEVGVPIAQFLEAPFYLFDEMDTIDKIDRAHLVPITRAVVRIVESTRGVTAEAMRAAHVSS